MRLRPHSRSGGDEPLRSCAKVLAPSRPTSEAVFMQWRTRWTIRGEAVDSPCRTWSSETRTSSMWLFDFAPGLSLAVADRARRGSSGGVCR